MPKPKPTAGTTHVCQMCGASWVRYHNLGKPKWCSQRCADLGKFGASRVCKRCGKTYFGVGKIYCSRSCAGSGTKSTIGGAEIGRAAIAEDWALVLRLIREACEPNAEGCWIWQARFDAYGYPIVRRGKSSAGAHRICLEAKRQARLGSQAAHHACANRRCVNPDHLIPVTHAENAAEMLARKSYISRIRDLEQALSEVAPSHPLLTATIPVA